MRAERRWPVILALGVTQTLAWASSYYLPAILATAMAADLGLGPGWVFGAFSLAMLIAGLLGPAAGRWIDQRGGRQVLVASNLTFAAGLLCLWAAEGPVMLYAGWAVLGAGMAIGLYEAAFAALAAAYGMKARGPITGVTLLGGFASTVGWPVSAYLLATWGWREACLVWAALHLTLGLGLNLWLAPTGTRPAPRTSARTEDQGTVPAASERLVMALLAFVFAAGWFTATAMAAHLPRLLELAGATPAAAIIAGMLVGPAQVVARIAEFSAMSRVGPLLSARVAAICHPVGALALLVLGPIATWPFAAIHGFGNGILTIAKGTLPLLFFGPQGYGRRQGVLVAPSRFVQAGAPLLFGLAIDAWGVQALWITTALGALAFVALMRLRAPEV